MESRSIVGTVVQQTCTGLDLSRCQRPKTVQESIGQAYYNLYNLRYFYATLWILLSLLTMPLKLHLIHVVLVLLVAQIIYTLEPKPLGEYPAHVLHLLIGVCVVYSILLVIFDATAILTIHLTVYGTAVYAHSSSFPANTNDSASVTDVVSPSSKVAGSASKHTGSGLMGSTLV